MPEKAGREIPPAEDLLLPFERTGQSAEDAGRSLFEAMESAGLDYDDLDHPSDDEPEAEPRRRREPAPSQDEPEDEEFDEELDDEIAEDSEEDFEDEDDFEDDEPEGEEPDEPELFEVTLPGGEKTQVTLDELVRGYSRTADYTRKRQRDADEHRQAMESLRGIREEYSAKLAKLNETLESLGPKKPDPALRRTNPGEYAAQKAEYEEYQRYLEDISAEQGTIDEDRQRELDVYRDSIIAQEREALFKAVPEWSRNPEQAQRELAELAEFAVREWGFTEQQLNQVVDHRLVLMLRENKQARDRRTKGRQKLETKRAKARRLQPGARVATTRSNRGRRAAEAKRMRQQVARRGGTSLREAARLLELEAGDDLL